MRKKRR